MNVRNGVIVISYAVTLLEVSSVLVLMGMSVEKGQMGQKMELVWQILLLRKWFYIWHITTKFWPWIRQDKNPNRYVCLFVREEKNKM